MSSLAKRWLWPGFRRYLLTTEAAVRRLGASLTAFSKSFGVMPISTGQKAMVHWVRPGRLIQIHSLQPAAQHADCLAMPYTALHIALQLADHLVQISLNLAQLVQLVLERWPTWQALLP